MIQIVFSIYFFVQFYKRAKQSGKNPVLWSILGGGCFLLISGTIPDAIAYAVYFLIAEEAFLLARFIGIVVGLIAAVVVTKRVLSRALPEAEQPDVTGLDKFDIATGRHSPKTPTEELVEVDAPGQEAAKALRGAGYRVDYVDGKWQVTDAAGAIRQYFSSAADMASQQEFLISRTKKA